MTTASLEVPPEWVKDLPAEKATKPDSWPPKTDLPFDWNVATFEVYCDPERKDFNNAAQRKPDFSKARSQLDYDYHRNPAQSRQELQDTILSRVVYSNTEDGQPLCCPSKPWIVFTAGAMGVGKGYVLSSLQQSDLFPLDKFLIIDPDMLKNELPEMAGYLRADPATAATKVHRESTQMADVLLEHALLIKAPILVDGSLRDVEYYKTLFQRIRNDYDYRIAIIMVTAKPEIIHDRARERAKKTGRSVPDELINESIKQVPRSVKELSPFADGVFEIANDDDKPLRIVSSSLPGDTISWNDFADTWTDEAQKREKKTCILKRKCCKSVCKTMSACWIDSNAHDCARSIWGKAYPNMCPRCTLSEDAQCGVCIHGKHLCACEDCAQVCPVRKSLIIQKEICISKLLGR